ncbi:LytR/AlgR family response regulator transcription factor [Arcicella rigui]|uniref:LytTR family DNA-binding domain-containing protein n=1 Tax=Arcicella rigui TaxID=797020 RepID=A0ABU5QEM9_9BACT|nr:LytTR family DNA-binding domain-containing protein [Arcicella rigui]MEA5141320.1 LytTR family DNA-binding domain-containing protein [Arcicella rigui]
MKLKTLIVDDEPLALDVLETFIERIDTLELYGRCENGIQAFNYLNKGEIDLLFLDIEMPTLDGMELLKSLQNPPKVIITTAYREYAVESFELSVVDYLVKPIPFQRFVKAVNKVIPKEKEIPTPSSQSISSFQITERNEKPEAMFIKVDKRIVKVNFADILFIESLKDYIRIHTVSGAYVTYQTMNGICEILPSESFARIHKSFIVAIDKVTSIEAGDLVVCGKSLPIGRSFRDDILEKIYKTGILAVK